MNFSDAGGNISNKWPNPFNDGTEEDLTAAGCNAEISSMVEGVGDSDGNVYYNPAGCSCLQQAMSTHNELTKGLACGRWVGKAAAAVVVATLCLTDSLDATLPHVLQLPPERPCLEDSADHLLPPNMPNRSISDS